MSARRHIAGAILGAAAAFAPVHGVGSEETRVPTVVEMFDTLCLANSGDIPGVVAAAQALGLVEQEMDEIEREVFAQTSLAAARIELLDLQGFAPPISSLAAGEASPVLVVLVSSHVLTEGTGPETRRLAGMSCFVGALLDPEPRTVAEQWKGLSARLSARLGREIEPAARLFLSQGEVVWEWARAAGDGGPPVEGELRYEYRQSGGAITPQITLTESREVQ